MNEWMREGEKYLQSDTYKKCIASGGSKQNAVVKEMRERGIRVGDGFYI